MVRVELEDDINSSGETELKIGSASNSIDSWRQCIRGEGKTFKGVAEFRICVKNYSISTRRSFCFKKNNRDKVDVVCSDENCDWRIYASKHKSDNIFGIRKCNLTHTCGEDNLRSIENPKADSTWVANLVKEKLRGEPSYCPCTMVKDIQRDFGVEIEYHKAWMGREMAMHDIHGTKKGSYDKLRWYCHAVKQTNPGSFAEYEIDQMTNKFKRLFICFHACLVGFASDAENDCNWKWFCDRLKYALASQGIFLFHSFTFFSDRHPGFIKVIQSVFHGSHHAYCLRHLVDNFIKQVLRRYPLHNKKHWSSVLKKAAYAPSRHEFLEHINRINESMPLASEFIVNSSPENWANALFMGYIDEGDTIYAPTVRSQPGRRRTERIPSQVEHHVTKCLRGCWSLSMKQVSVGVAEGVQDPVALCTDIVLFLASIIY
ncbi:uncharacterized protein [Henckelia pumila]|uniref:uncharacterized protein n=1 Tax=Henckelia pumila TaxID=405737 RepID=UPI003C6E9088